MTLRTLPWPLELAARFGIAALVPLVLIGSLVLGLPHVIGLPENAALRVGDTVVTEDELHERVEMLEALYGIRQPPGGLRADVFRRQAAEAVALSIVLDHAAKERGIVISDRSVHDTLNKLIERKFPKTGRDAFVKLLGNVGASLQDVLDEIKQQRSIARLFRQVTAEVPEARKADLRAAYDRYRQQMVIPEQRRLQSIVVATKQRAQEVMQRAHAGVDFAKLVEQYSLDERTRKSGGDLGFVRRAQLAQRYAKAAFATPERSLFGPVKTQFGWNIGKVVEVRPRRRLTFEQAKRQLRTELHANWKAEAWRNWLTTQIRDADIDYADKYRPSNPNGAKQSSLGNDGPTTNRVDKFRCARAEALC